MKLFNDVLESSGYRTLKINDGHQAIAIARDDRPDLILMDTQLPEVSGREVTKWIKDDKTSCVISIIAVTALAMKDDEERTRRGGCEGYISKPISVVTFLETVTQQIG
jgi:two-component system cell cycle response regulator DivK